jgi:spermidine synthase
MYLDGTVNVNERDQSTYHEMISHVPMMSVKDPKRVLVVGGGDGGTVRQLLKHSNLEKIIMVDIDEIIINEFKKSKSSEDSRLEIIVGDGIEWVKNAKEEDFDVVIVESSDSIPDGFSESTYSVEFYKNCHRILSSKGVITTQSLMPMVWDADIFKRSLANIQTAFTKEKSTIYLIPTESYSGQTSFSLCWKGESNPKDMDKARIKAFTEANKLKYYNAGMHRSSFALPNYIDDSINDA